MPTTAESASRCGSRRERGRRLHTLEQATELSVSLGRVPSAVQPHTRSITLFTIRSPD